MGDTHFSRRQWLLGLSSIGLTVGASGCGVFVRHPNPFCPNDPDISDPNTALTIDAHVHVFNASDLQIDDFFSRVLARKNKAVQDLGPVLQEIGWDLAPSGAEELEALRQVRAALTSCDVKGQRGVAAAFRQNGYQRGVTQLQEALARAQQKAAGRGLRRAVPDDVARQIRALPDSAERYRAQRRSARRLSRRELNIQGAIAFILRNFQFRYVNVYDYLRDYSSGPTRKIDLIVAHLIDYDWPIGDAQPTRTGLAEQVRLMEEMSVVTGGRVHCFAPYDPFKEVAFQVGQSAESPFALVKDAVENRGFIGVKLYPPMGFAALGNAGLPAGFWEGSWIPKQMLTPDLGPRLDTALAALYGWCRQNDVAIMAHTNLSNGPSDKFENLVAAKYWKIAVDAFPGLRVNFGHFGETDPVLDGGGTALQFARLMTSAPGSGENLFADSAYFSEILTRPPALEARLAELYRATAGKGDAALAQRLMYGTDWEMIIVEGGATEDYLARFEQIFASLDRTSGLGANGRLSDRFFGANAVNLLGLANGQLARQRLQAFYTRTGVPSPHWMQKSERLVA